MLLLQILMMASLSCLCLYTSVTEPFAVWDETQDEQAVSPNGRA